MTPQPPAMPPVTYAPSLDDIADGRACAISRRRAADFDCAMMPPAGDFCRRLLAAHARLRDGAARHATPRRSPFHAAPFAAATAATPRLLDAERLSPTRRSAAPARRCRQRAIAMNARRRAAMPMPRHCHADASRRCMPARQRRAFTPAPGASRYGRQLFMLSRAFALSTPRCSARFARGAASDAAYQNVSAN